MIWHYVLWTILGYIIGRAMFKYVIIFCKEILEIKKGMTIILTIISHIPIVNMLFSLLFFMFVIILASIGYSIYYFLKYIKYID
jgi:hypothetical protein